MKIPPLKVGEYHWIDRGIFARGQRTGPPRYGCSYTIPARVAQSHGVSRRRRELVGTSLTSARRRLARRKTQIADKDWSFLDPPREAVPTLRQFAARYIEYAKTTKKSWAFDRACLRAFLDAYGNRSLDALLPAQVDQFKAARAIDVSPRTVNHELQVVHLLFAAAVRWNVLERNPAAGVKRLKVPRKVIRVLSAEEEPRLLAAAPDHLRDLILLVLHTGLRKSEALGLRWKDIDLEERVLTVRAGKGDKARFIPINNTAAAALGRRRRDVGHVFTWQGKPILDIKMSWTRTLRRAGIHGLTFHNLRDTFATRAVHRGVNLVTLRDLLGHSTIEMTVKYAHPTPEANRKAVALLDDAFGESGTSR